MKETYEIPDVEIIATGEHQGHAFNEEAIERLLHDTNEVIESLRRRPFAHIGHTRFNERPDQLPRAANIPEMFYRGGKILAKFADIPKAIYKAMVNGALPKRSVEMTRNYEDKLTGKVYPWIIDSVALISTHPEVTDLNDYEKLYAAEDAKYERICGTELAGWPTAGDERIKMAEEVKPQETPKAEAPPEPAPAIVADEKADALQAITAERDALKAELEALKAEKAGDSEKIAALERRINEMGVDSQLDKLVHSGKLTPAERDAEKVHLMELRGLPNKVRFGEKDVTLYERRIAELDGREPKVKFGERAPEGSPDSKPEPTDAELKKRGLSRAQWDKVKGLL